MEIPELKTNEPRQECASIKIRKNLAQLLRVYCIFNNQKVYDFTGKVLEKELEEFKNRIKLLQNK